MTPYFPTAGLHRCFREFLKFAAAAVVLSGCGTTEETAIGPDDGVSPAVAASRRESADDVARFLAGLEGETAGPLASLRETPGWDAHRSRMRILWQKHKEYRGTEIGSWSRRELRDLQHPDFVFYPFSGPDFLFAETLFPGAGKYVLVGLEKIDPLPSLTGIEPQEVTQGLDGVGASMQDFLIFSYFQTKNMRSNLGKTRFQGVLPVLYTFLALTEHTVDRVERVGLDANGNLFQSSGGNGVHIAFHSQRGARKDLYYFQENLADSNLISNRRLPAFLKSQGHPVTFIKSASYLMHEGGFSAIRQYILKDSVAVVQDPSGVPFRYFTAPEWRVNLYGSYRGPIDVFSEHRQEDLLSAYRGGKYPAGRIKFGMGYGLNAMETSLIVARRE